MSACGPGVSSIAGPGIKEISFAKAQDSATSASLKEKAKARIKAQDATSVLTDRLSDVRAQLTSVKLFIFFFHLFLSIMLVYVYFVYLLKLLVLTV
jgi:hypothetical protein